MSPLVSCLLLVFGTVAHSGLIDPRVDDISLKISWVTETRMELTIGERRRNICLTPSTNIPGWKTPCLFTGKLEGDLDAEVFVSGCHNSKETMVSIASSLLSDGFVELMIVDGNTKNMDSPRISGETEGEESMENSTPDYIDYIDYNDQPANPWSGPLPSTVVLKTDIKYDNSLLEHFDYSHEKTKDWLNKVIQFVKPMMSHNSLSIKVALEIGEVNHIDETLEADNHTIDYLAQTKNHKTLTSYFCKDNRRRGYSGIAFIGTACNPRFAININELSTYSDRETAKTFAHELGHNIDMDHDFHEKHGGHFGKCNHQGLMSYGHTPIQWSSCSDKDFKTWWKEEGHVCLMRTTDKQHGDSFHCDDSDYDTIEVTDKPDSLSSDDSEYDTIEGTDKPDSLSSDDSEYDTIEGTDKPDSLSSDDSEYDTIEGTDKPDSLSSEDSEYDTIEGTDKPGPGPDSGDWGNWR